MSQGSRRPPGDGLGDVDNVNGERDHNFAPRPEVAGYYGVLGLTAAATNQ